jgi:YfiR/HmsC-like
VAYKVRVPGLSSSQINFRRLCAVTVAVLITAASARGQEGYAYNPPGELKRLSVEDLHGPEYQVKALFLFNFAQFISWPSSQPSDTPFVIGIVGDDPFDSYLDETVRGEKVNNRSLTTQRFRHGRDPRTCDILFISQSERERAAEIVSNLRGRSVLTVSDIDGFADLGGMIELFTEKNKIRMRINLEAVKAANLKVSSKLLRVAEVKH